jgi:ribosome production factor 1
MTDHRPELILNRFSTRLGHRVGRMLASLFPKAPQFGGRRVVTFHNQRDFIFFRQHRYIFEEQSEEARKAAREVHGEDKKMGVRVRLQELGPRFTMKLVSLQDGPFDPKFGEFEWIRKKKDEALLRRKFAL